MAIHFVGFRGDEFIRAMRIFGQPDFIHRYWDVRAQQEVVEGDMAIFASADETTKPSCFSFDDSQYF